MTPTGGLTRGGVVWKFSLLGRELLTPEMLDLAAHVTAGRAETVKDGAHRTVHRVRAGGLDLFWKHGKITGPRARWRDIFRGAKSGVEFRRLEALRSKDIPTIVPLAWGRLEWTWWPRGSFLITQALPNAVTLGDYLTSKLFVVAERRLIAVKLAGLMAHMHAAGVVHADLHPGNILVDAERPGDDWRLIDVHDLKAAGGPLSPAARVKNLVILNRWFSLRTSRTDRLAFWRAYQKAAQSPDTTVVEIEQKTEESNLDLWQSRDRRCLTDNKDFRRQSFGDNPGHARRDAPAGVLAAMSDPEELLRHPSVRLLKDSKTSTVAVVQIDGTAYVLKRFRIKRWFTPLANIFRPSPAMRSWIGACAMDNRQLPTPRALAVTHRRRFGLPREGYLLMEHLPAARSLDEITGDSLGVLTEATARFVRLMHRRGLSHRDLKSSNMLVSNGDLYLIDLVGLERRRLVPLQRRRRDVTRLCVSSLHMPGVTRASRLRWLRAYLGGRPAEWADWKGWWRDIARRCLDKMAKNRRGGRALH